MQQIREARRASATVDTCDGPTRRALLRAAVSDPAFADPFAAFREFEASSDAYEASMNEMLDGDDAFDRRRDYILRLMDDEPWRLDLLDDLDAIEAERRAHIRLCGERADAAREVQMATLPRWYGVQRILPRAPRRESRPVFAVQCNGRQHARTRGAGRPAARPARRSTTTSSSSSGDDGSGSPGHPAPPTPAAGDVGGLKSSPADCTLRPNGGAA